MSRPIKTAPAPLAPPRATLELHGAGRQETDSQLFASIAAGDLGPLGVLFDRYHEDVHQFVIRAAPHAEDLDDLVQETFLTAARAATAYDGRASARPFLIGV